LDVDLDGEKLKTNFKGGVNYGYYTLEAKRDVVGSF